MTRIEQLARQWLRRAEGNLARAEQPKPPDGFWEDLCFDAQQAAEKAVKGVFVSQNIRFPLSHDLGELLTRLEEEGVEVSDEIKSTKFLTDYAVTTRYPHWGGPVTEEEYQKALDASRKIVAWARKSIEG